MNKNKLSSKEVMRLFKGKNQFSKNIELCQYMIVHGFDPDQMPSDGYNEIIIDWAQFPIIQAMAQFYKDNEK
jgi:hypothetical protein